MERNGIEVWSCCMDERKSVDKSCPNCDPDFSRISFVHEHGKSTALSWVWAPCLDWYRHFYAFPGYHDQWPEFTVLMKFN